MEIIKSLEQKLINILKLAKNKNYHEIYIKQNNSPLFYYYENGNPKIEKMEINYKIDYNQMFVWYSELLKEETKLFDKSKNTNLNEQEKIKTFYLEDEDMYFTIYFFIDKDALILYIKFLQAPVDAKLENIIEKYILKKVQEQELSNSRSMKDYKSEFYKKMLLQTQKIFIVASNNEYLSNKFMYYIINDINEKLENRKIVLFQETEEIIFKNEKAFIFQKKMRFSQMNNTKFLRPQYVFLFDQLNKGIFEQALNFTINGSITFLKTNNLEIKDVIEKLKDFLNKDGMFTENTLFNSFGGFIILSFDNKDKIIKIDEWYDAQRLIQEMNS